MEKYKVIVDTNLWISLLIGKRLAELRDLCNSGRVAVYICDELLEEFTRISARDKIRKYAADERVVQTLELIKASCITAHTGRRVVASGLRDVNDLYLLALAENIPADFILTGDKDLLSLQTHHQTKIVTFNEFKAIIEE